MSKIVDLELANVPQALANAFGISLFSAQLLTCTIFLLMFSLPIAIVGRDNKGIIILDATMDFILIGFFVAIGWLGTWALIFIIFLIAGIYALMWKGLGD